MADIIGEQEHSQSPFAQLSKKHNVSWLSDSMEEVIGELEETATSPCQTPLSPHLSNDSSSSKKKRGPTKCLKTNGLRDEDRLQVRLNVFGQPAGSSRAKLSSYLGTLARNAHLAPLTYTSWKGLKSNWDDLWNIVISKFDIEIRARKWVLQTICSCWRTHKCRVKKKYFKPNMTEDYNIKNQPPNVPLEHWKILVKFWKSDSAKACSKKNKVSRAKQTSVHTIGSKTFADIRDEETKKNPNGREPSRVQMYVITHKPKHGRLMNEGTRKVISELEEAIALHPEALEQTTARDDLFSQVVGKDPPGRLRTYGKGVVPSDLWGSQLHIGTQKLVEEVKRNAQSDLQNIQEKMQQEMQVKLQEQVEVIKTEMLGGFKIILSQMQKSFPGIVIPDLSSMCIPNTNGEANDTRASTVTHQAAPHDLQTDEEIETTVRPKDNQYKKKEKRKMFGKEPKKSDNKRYNERLGGDPEKLKGKKTQGLVKNVENYERHKVAKRKHFLVPSPQLD